MHKQSTIRTPSESSSAPTLDARSYATGIIVFNEDGYGLGEQFNEPNERPRRLRRVAGYCADIRGQLPRKLVPAVNILATIPHSSQDSSGLGKQQLRDSAPELYYIRTCGWDHWVHGKTRCNSRPCLTHGAHLITRDDPSTARRLHNNKWHGEQRCYESALADPKDKPRAMPNH